MRIRYQQPTGIWERQPGQCGSGVIPLEWRQDWFTNVCLMIILAVVLFLMLLSIYMVFSKPAPTAVPEPDRTGRLANGSPLAQILPENSTVLLTINNQALAVDHAVWGGEIG